MRNVEVEPDEGIARVEAGARAGEVAGAAGGHRLAPVLGLAPTVGVVGLALGGGTGWLSRAHGLAANNVSVHFVTATGERLRADAHTEPELFWALRGGGGRFAIVTAVEALDVHPVADVSAGMPVWPWTRRPRCSIGSAAGRWTRPSQWARCSGTSTCRRSTRRRRPSAGATSR